jgi:hypothetical protein
LAIRQANCEEETATGDDNTLIVRHYKCSCFVQDNTEMPAPQE